MTSDNGSVKRVVVNGRALRPMAPSSAEREITREGRHPGTLKLTASAEDAVGSREKLPQMMSVPITR